MGFFESRGKKMAVGEGHINVCPLCWTQEENLLIVSIYVFILKSQRFVSRTCVYLFDVASWPAGGEGGLL